MFRALYSSVIPTVALLSVVLISATGCRREPARPAAEEPRPTPAAKETATAPTQPSKPTTTSDTAADAAKREVEQTIRALLDAWEKVDAVSVRIETRLEEAIGQPGKTSGEGTYDLKKGPRANSIRFKMANFLQIPIPDEPGSNWGMIEAVEWVTDGRVLHHYTGQFKLKKVVKSMYAPSQVFQIAGRELFQDLLENYRLKVLPDEKLLGRQCKVIEARPKEGSWTSLYHFDAESGVMIRLLEKDKEGKETTRIETVDIDLSPEFPPDHFEYQVPEDVEFIDETLPIP